MTELKSTAQNVCKVKSTTQQAQVFKIHRMFGNIKHSNEFRTFENKSENKDKEAQNIRNEVWKIQNYLMFENTSR